MHAHDKRIAAHIADGHKVTQWIVIGFVDGGQDGHHGHGRHQQGVAIGRGLAHKFGCNAATRANLVFHHNRLAQGLR